MLFSINQIKINEIFLSIQGESINTGVQTSPFGVGTPTIFIRTYGCNNKCNYCDTKHAWDGSEKGVSISIKEIMKIVHKLSRGVYKNVCITGGEPGLQKNISDLISALKKEKYVVSVETSGSVDIVQFYGADSIVMDWKGPSAGTHAMFNMLEANWKYLRRCDQVKFLIQDKKDWEFMENTIKRVGILDRENKPVLLVSPVFSDDGKVHNAQQIVKWIFKSKLPLILNFQIHKLIWDVKKRGV